MLGLEAGRQLAPKGAGSAIRDCAAGGFEAHTRGHLSRGHLKAWNDVPVEQQEKIIGRKKLSDIELEDAAKPPYAHNVLTTIEENGEELAIVRDNMPFGEVGKGELGTHFVGYARSPARADNSCRVVGSRAATS